MRRRIIFLSLAVTGLVVVAFSLPLALLVRQQAITDAQTQGEQTAQSVASLVALSTALAESVDPEVISDAVGRMSEGQVIYLPDGQAVGNESQGQGTFAEEVARRQETVSSSVPGGWEVDIPVVTSEGPLVVSVFVPDSVLTAGVSRAWLLLALLGVVIVAAAVLVADRLGRSLVDPMNQLVEASHRLGRGDFNSRVEIAEPEEMAELGRTFNWVADRLRVLLQDQREAMADLSHDLRTPLTALRLQADRLDDRTERLDVLSHVDRLEAEIDRLITRARDDGAASPAVCDLSATVRQRHQFWAVLAKDQDRPTRALMPEDEVMIRSSHESVVSVIDALVGNVFSHTEPGVGFDLIVDVENGLGRLAVADEGPGWPQGDILQRGSSSGGSTGLGLDIARRAAETGGGYLKLDNRPGGGAVVTVGFSLV